jgi:clorobiocin biosynthesis protein CloN5
LDEDTPLLEYGILNSLNTAVLIAHIRDEFGIAVPLADVNAESFRTVSALSRMLDERQSVADARAEG